MKKSEEKRRVAIVTGGATGIGAAVAQRLRDAGWTVRVFSRRTGVDLTDAASADAALARVLSEEGGADLLVNNAGAGVFGAAEQTGGEAARRLFDLNYFAAVHLTERLIPVFRERGGGTVINVCSLAAVLPLPFQSHYSASKAALLAWTRALAGEVARFGIRVTAVCPGDVRTPFTASRECVAEADARYGGAIGRARAKAEASERGGQAPDVVAREIVRFASAAHPPLVAVPGFGYAMLDRLARLLPRTLVSSLVTRLYT